MPAISFAPQWRKQLIFRIVYGFIYTRILKSNKNYKYTYSFLLSYITNVEKFLRQKSRDISKMDLK
jgi:hypothetical protein